MMKFEVQSAQLPEAYHRCALDGPLSQQVVTSATTGEIIFDIETVHLESVAT